MIKRCPTCGYQNPAEAWFCTNPDLACDAPLAHVDAVAPGPAVDAAPSGTVADTPTGTDLPGPTPVAAGGVACPDPDCGQANPPGAERCQYCGTTLARPPAPESGTGVRLRFPWGVEPLEETLRIGRNPSFSLLARRLHPRYDNVSNRHAELRLEDGRILVVDLGSSNGTFVNDRRIGQNSPVEVRLGDRVRFAADLVATIEAGDG